MEYKHIMDNNFMSQPQNPNPAQPQESSQPSFPNQDNLLTTPPIISQVPPAPNESKTKKPIIIGAVLSLLLVVVIVCAIIFIPKLIDNGQNGGDGQMYSDDTTTSDASDDASDASSLVVKDLKKYGFIRSYNWDDLHEFIGIDQVEYNGMKLPLTGAELIEKYSPDSFMFRPNSSSRAKKGDSLSALNDYAEGCESVEFLRNATEASGGYDRQLETVYFGKNSSLSDFENGNFYIKDSITPYDSVRVFGISSDEYDRLEDISSTTGYAGYAIDMHLILQKFGKPTGVIFKSDHPNLYPSLYWETDGYIIAISYKDILGNYKEYLNLVMEDVYIGPKALYDEQGLQYEFVIMPLEEYLSKYPDVSIY